MAPSTDQQFTALLRSRRFRDGLYSYLSTSDICAVRSASSACCNLVTKDLFTRVHVSFSANTFTKQPRLEALSRIGHHIEHLTFYLAHSRETFLPPLIHPRSGKEIAFLYTPHTSVRSAITRPKYANTELGDILTQQYPPLFHAATNTPSFISAFRSLPNVRHLTVRCPGQDPKERYRRGIVDYALISLRIALERAPMDKLIKLSLSSVHPSAFNYLRHVPGFGCIPSAARRWRQIRKLNISVEAWDFYGSSPGLDQLKILDDYIRNMSPSLEKLSFRWIGLKGPCPVALAADPLFAPPKTSRKLFHEVTSPMSPLPSIPMRQPMHFPKLQYLQIRNATMNAPQLKELITSHRDTVREFDFESVVLINSGDWEEALAPLDKDDTWWRSSLTTSSAASAVTNDSDDELQSPSAAVEAASRALLNDSLGTGSAEKEVVEGLSEDVAAAREASMSFTTNLTKQRVRRRRKHRAGNGEAHPRHSGSCPQAPCPLPEPPQRPPSTRSSLRSRPEAAASAISAPILDPEPQPVLLQPTVYNPAARRHTPPEEGISAVQRDLEKEEAHRRLAEDATARTSALRRAKEAVLAKLSREFCTSNRGQEDRGFGVRTTAAVAACRVLASRDFPGCGMEVLEDRLPMESQTALVPLMFSRA